MKTPRILTTTIALLLTTRAFAVTDTWDGGGGNDNLSTGANWVDGSAPVSDLVNTDLIFAGVVRLTPNVSVAFRADSITFNNTAGAFVIDGQVLNVGDGGIANADTQTMTFNNLVNFGGVGTSTINAVNGGLTFTDTVTMPSGSLFVTGTDPTNFANLTGGSQLIKNGTGTMTWTPNVPTAFDITLSVGTLTIAADGVADVFNSTATINVNGTSILNLNESITLDGARITRVTGADINLAAGKTLTVQDGGEVEIIGTFSNSTASTIAVTGVGSSFNTTSALSLIGGSTITVAAGGTVTAGTANVNIGTSGNGTVTVTGSGSSFSGGGTEFGPQWRDRDDDLQQRQHGSVHRYPRG